MTPICFATQDAKSFILRCSNRLSSGSQEYILLCLRRVLTEAIASADWEGVDTSLWLVDVFHMGLAVLRIWSRVFSNTSAWPITVTIGKSLTIYANAYENRELTI
jgi:hypothetical protein